MVHLCGDGSVAIPVEDEECLPVLRLLLCRQPRHPHHSLKQAAVVQNMVCSVLGAPSTLGADRIVDRATL